MAQHNKKGDLGEKIAQNFLVENGFNIIAQNWREHRFEIDIIASKEGVMHFIEVKTRTSTKIRSDFSATNAVTKKKLDHLCQGVQFYVDKYELNLNISLDLVAVDIVDGEIIIEHIQGIESC